MTTTPTSPEEAREDTLAKLRVADAVLTETQARVAELTPIANRTAWIEKMLGGIHADDPAMADHVKAAKLYYDAVAMSCDDRLSTYKHKVRELEAALTEARRERDEARVAALDEVIAIWRTVGFVPPDWDTPSPGKAMEDFSIKLYALKSAPLTADVMSERRRSNYLSPPQLHSLRCATRPVNEAFDTVAYLVGSAITSPTYRDVDVRVILQDDEFRRLFGNELDQIHGKASAFWTSVVVTYSRDLSWQTRLNIDFQVQASTIANKDHGQRQALIVPTPIDRASQS